MNNLIAQGNANKTNANSNTANSNKNVNAQVGGNAEVYVTPPPISNPVGEDSLLAVGSKFINFLLAMIVIASVVVIIIAGFRMVVGSGNEAQIKKAKKAILYAIGGLAIAIASFAIVQIIQSVLS